MGRKTLSSTETGTRNADWMAYYNHLMNPLPPNWDPRHIYSSSTSVIKDEKYNTDVYFSGEGVVLIVDPSVENELCCRKIRLNYTPVAGIKRSCCVSYNKGLLRKSQ